MNFGSRISIPMILPNGVTRIIQYNKNTENANWVAIKDGRQKSIAGFHFAQLGKHYFLPKNEEDRLWIIETHKSKRTRLKSPLTLKEYLNNKEYFKQKNKTKAIDSSSNS